MSLLMSDDPTSPSAGEDDHRARQVRSERTQQLLEAAARQTQDGRRAELLNEVVVLNRELAIGIAHHFRRSGVDVEDLEQVALLGLTKAAHRYSCAWETSFCTFAFPTITGEVKRYFRDCTWSVRPPRALQESVLAIRGTQAELTQRLGHRPNHVELAQATGLEPCAVAKATLAAEGFSAMSLDTPVANRDGVDLAETIADPRDDFDRVDTHSALQTGLQGLPPRDRLIVSLRFDQDLTQEQIGAVVGLSQMQVSRQLSRVFSRLRDYMQACSTDAAENPALQP